MDPVRAAVAALLRRQDGVISRTQALASGMTSGAIRWQLETNTWERVHPSVYRSAAHPTSTAGRLRAASLWAGDLALVAGVAAAWWWGLAPVGLTTVELWIPVRRHLRRQPRTTIVRRYIPPDDRDQHRGVPVTGLALTALHAAVAMGEQGGPMLDRALQGRVSFTEIRAAHYRNMNIAGAALAGKLLAQAADRSAAMSERLCIKLLKDAGITGWRINRHVDDIGEFDIVFDDARVVLEIDGWAWHHTPDRFQRDRAKQNRIVLGGWTVLRFTWFDLNSRPRTVIAQVRAAVDTGLSPRAGRPG